MRIAWLGPAPSEERGGVPYAASLFLDGLAECGVHVDCFLAVPKRSLPNSVLERPELTFFCHPPRWHWNQWYRRTPFLSFLTGQGARALAQTRLASLIARRHTQRPYDLFYQFSQLELFTVRRLRASFPPIIVHPEVHAAGELYWHRRETELARQSEPTLWNLAVRQMLATRAWKQKRDVHLARMVIAVSNHFAADISRDYQFPSDRIRVVRNPVDLQRFYPQPPSQRRSPGKITLLFISRLAVRKGVEMVVRLSHRLTDLADQVQIYIIGDHSMWSDYRRLLSTVNRDVATYLGPIAPTKLPDVYRSADGLLQPSHYDPCPFTVGEALASGLPVVVTNQVGSAEGVDSRCCLVFPAGDVAAFESAVRDLVGTLRGEDQTTVKNLARAEAERLFTPRELSATLVTHLEEAVAEGDRVGSGEAL
jgi:glycosyltransferase involved in cell wall biosynthesis